jgi:uncharacterized RDD family membrane protein YckC
MEDVSQESSSNQPAGFFSRFEAFIIDLILLSLSGVIAAWVIRQIISFFQLKLFWDRLPVVLPITFFSTVYVLLYVLFFWTLLGYTPGKMLLGLKIVRRGGQRLTLGRSLLRFIGYWVSAIPLFLGFLWIIFDRRRQGWHDKLADTQVIYTWKIKL